MVLVHFMENLAGADWAPAGFGAPLFTFLVGVSYRIWLNAQEAKNKDDSEITRVSVRRGVFLFVTGFVFNIVVWLPDDTFNWDVLTLIGTAFVVLAFVRNLPLTVIAFFAASAYVLAPVLRDLTDYSAYWVEGYFDCEWTFLEIGIGYIATGYFPLCPWLAFPLAGYIVGTLFFATYPGERAPTGRVALVGLAFIFVAVLMLVSRRFAPASLTSAVLRGWTMFPPSLEYVTGMLGMAMLVFSLMHRYMDPHSQAFEKTRTYIFFNTFSKFSFSMYWFHHILHLWPLWLYGLCMGQEATHYWRKAMPTSAAIPLAAVCLVVSFALFRWLDRTKRGSLESLMRRLCEKPRPRSESTANDLRMS
jgi:uncharacterized membrane protein